MGGKVRWVAVAIVAVLTVGVVFQLLRPRPGPRVAYGASRSLTVPGAPLALRLPAAGQASVFLAGTGWVAQSVGQTPVAMASVTKLMTALLVVRARPLALGQSGPTVTITPAAVALYQQERAAGDSVVQVVSGEALSEFQLLEGILLPSGDNLATLLAEWTSGSEAAFVAQMNLEAHRLGMDQTVYADASGLSPGSISTASDLTRLAATVMGVPVLAEIAAMPQAELPVAGVVRNYDYVLGQQGIVGLKTGWTSSAGGCFVFAARLARGGRSAELLGAVLGQPGNALTGIEAAEKDSVALLSAVWPKISLVRLVPVGARVGGVTVPWSSPVGVLAKHELRALGWPGLVWRAVYRSEQLPAKIGRGTSVGDLTLTAAGGGEVSTPLVAQAALSPPSWMWRLSHT